MVVASAVPGARQASGGGLDIAQPGAATRGIAVHANESAVQPAGRSRDSSTGQEARERGREVATAPAQLPPRKEMMRPEQADTEPSHRKPSMRDTGTRAEQREDAGQGREWFGWLASTAPMDANSIMNHRTAGAR